MKANLRTRAKTLADRCQDAYSARTYRTWSSVAYELLRLGFNERQAEDIMRSKWTRWATDTYTGSSRYGRIPAKAVRNFVVAAIACGNKLPCGGGRPSGSRPL